MDAAKVHGLVEGNVEAVIKEHYKETLDVIVNKLTHTLNILCAHNYIKCYAFFQVTSSEVSFEYQLPWYNGPYGWVNCTVTWKSCKYDTGGTQMSTISEDGPMDVEELQEYLELLTNVAEGKESIEELCTEEEKKQLHEDIVRDYERAMEIV